MQPLNHSTINLERTKIFLESKKNAVNRQILSLKNPELIPVEKINHMLSKVSDPALSVEEIFDILNDISVLFIDNKISIYFSNQI